MCVGGKGTARHVHMMGGAKNKYSLSKSAVINRC